jgi:cobalt-zinc-cadmium efflux system outer membrane protein
MPELGADPRPQPGPQGKPLTLADLQNLAMSNSPLIRQAASDVEGAKGAAIQVGAYPNPNFGYQADTAGTSATAGFQGFFLEQTIRTGGKLKLAQAAAAMDLLNSQLALRRAQFDLVTAVRNAYYGVLVAEENIQVAHALAVITDAAYEVFVDQFRLGGLPAAYEPLQLRAQAFQARGALVQARNRYLAGWKQLAATLGLPAMPPTQLAGRADMPLPRFRYDEALARVLGTHTDVLTAQNTLQRSRYNLRLAQVTPVPDVNLHLAVEKDFSMPPFLTTYSIQLGGPLPIWDRNKGNIIQAQGALLRATEQAHQVRDDLTNRLATAFEQYEDNRILLEYYRGRIIPDLVQSYRGIVLRYGGGDVNVGFIDFLNVQQNLVAAYTTYLATLMTAWTSVTGVADLMQINDLYQFGQEPATALPCLEQLQTVPCCHPCSRLPDPALKGANGAWPQVIPEGPTPAATQPEAAKPNGSAPRPAPQEAQGSSPAWTPSPARFAWPPAAASAPAAEAAPYRPPSLRSLQESQRASEGVWRQGP